jgi:hypothetical protein
MKDQEGWTHVTKKLRARKNDLKGFRYKGSKQYRTPVAKNPIEQATSNVESKQVFNIKANKVFINGKPSPPKDMMSDNYYSVLDFDDEDNGPMYQPRLIHTRPS